MFFRNLVCLTLFLCVSSLSAQDYWMNHRVSDPRGWESGQAYLEDMSVIVEPQGAFTQVDLTMILTTDFSRFGFNDSLEIVLDFELPKGSIVNDSWLWIGQDIIRAEIIDRATATEIYEEIVSRRQDPSLLTKDRHGDDYRYKLRIFPLTRQDHARKFRISYLVPAKWDAQEVQTSLPFPFIHYLSSNETLSVKVKPNDEWGIPRFVESPLSMFSLNEEGTYYEAEIPAQASSSDLHLAFNAPFQDGFYFSTTTLEEESFYQVAILPQTAFELETTAKKTVFLVDYDATNSATPRTSILSNLEAFIKQNFTAVDSFQIFLSNINSRPLTEDWISGKAEEVMATFDLISTAQIATYSNLTPLLVQGIQYINEQADNANIVLISNADLIADDSGIIDHRVQDVLGLMQYDTRIDIIDYQIYGLSRIYANGIRYRGNSYFYSKLSDATGGIYNSTHFNGNRSFESLFENGQILLSQQIELFDISAALQNGISYNKFSPFEAPNLYPSETIFQFGKYRGDFPFTINAGGFMGDEVFGKAFTITAEQAISDTDKLPQIWADYEIKQLENSHTTQDLERLTQLSLDYRVLALHTAFLALEPGQGGEICETCEDDGDPVATENILTDELVQIKVLANPFREKVTIQLQFADKLDLSNSQFMLTNAEGRTLKTFQAKDWKTIDGSYEFTWDGTDNLGNELPAGIYFFTIITKEGTKTIKLIKH